MKDEVFLNQKLVQCNKYDLERAMKMLEKVDKKKSLSDCINPCGHCDNDLRSIDVMGLIKDELQDVDEVIFMYKNFGAGEKPIGHIQKVLAKFKKRLEERAGKRLIQNEQKSRRTNKKTTKTK